MEIWVNPDCSKCGNALALLDEQGTAYTVRHYLEDPPSPQELEDVLRRLGLEPWDIIRTGEAAAKELGVESWGRSAADRPRWVEALVAHPVLIQRPIITVDDDTAVLGRSPETVRSVL